jgi:hypothetical protein
MPGRRQQNQRRGEANAHAADYNLFHGMTAWMNAARLTCVAVVYALAMGPEARAQTLPSEPIVFADGRVTVSGDAWAGIAPQDTGFFNYTDYEYSALRLLRFDVSASVKAGEHLTLLGEVRSDNLGRPRPYALYARIRPWARRAFDIQAGRIPPTFGAFAHRTYAWENPLIGYPLAYQYLTSLRPDSLPANADDLLKMRGRGWLSHFSIGNVEPQQGVPLVSILRWDTGVQVHAASDLAEATASVTAGTLSNPVFPDDNGGRQFAGRLALHPLVGLVIGASAAHGPFVSSSAARSATGGDGGDAFAQTAWGGDVEYSRGYYLVRVETVFSQWTLPSVEAPFINGPLTALATSVEGRYKITAGLYGAARLDHLGFSEVTGSAGRTTWDAPVSRVEVGGGYSIQRNLVLKLSYQHNSRDTERVPVLNLVAAQLVFWF